MILIINAGSSSIKFKLYKIDLNEEIARGLLDFKYPSGSILTIFFDGKKDVQEAEVSDYNKGI